MKEMVYGDESWDYPWEEDRKWCYRIWFGLLACKGGKVGEKEWVDGGARGVDWGRKISVKTTDGTGSDVTLEWEGVWR